MAQLSPEVREFLLKGTHTGKLATVRPDGRPHVVPVWFILEGHVIIFQTGGKSVKARNMRHNGDVCFCVDDETIPYAYVMIEGTVNLAEDPEDLLDWSTRIAARYVGEDKAARYGKMNASPGSVLVRLTPAKILFEPNITG